jgi:hypothetical protein
VVIVPAAPISIGGGLALSVEGNALPNQMRLEFPIAEVLEGEGSRILVPVQIPWRVCAPDNHVVSPTTGEIGG